MPTLDWLNRQDAFSSAARVPYRLLDQVSVHASSVRAPPPPVRPEPVEGLHNNLLIQGDNLEALKALLPFYRGQVKCIFIDPPYNTKSAFEHYDDNLEHSQWLSMMLPRLQLLRELLREDGSIWVTIDDNEGHYLKVLMDEVFGRGNFVANVVWQKKSSPQANAVWLSDNHDHLLVYGNSKSVWRPNMLQKDEASQKAYKNPDRDPRGLWKSTDFTISLTGGQRGAQYAKTGFSPNIYEITTPSGRKLLPARGRCWAATPTRLTELLVENRIWFGEDGNNVPTFKKFLSEDSGEIGIKTVWLRDEVGDNTEAKRETMDVNAEEVFSTPKPERLIQRILHIASNENDLVLDSFLGSGTTAAVAHKMRRRWIGIEMGEHAATHCLPRLQKVIDGEQGGISKALNWNGGGGFRFMRLGEPVFDEAGRIHSAVRFNTLAAFIWQQEARSAWDASRARAGTPHLGIHYELDSTPRNIHAGELPKTLEKTSEKEDLFTQPSMADQEPNEQALPAAPKPCFALYLLYNGILKDKRPQSGNVLTAAVLDALLTLHAACCQAAGENAQDIPLTVYGEACRLGPERLAQANVTFRHIPYDVRAR